MKSLLALIMITFLAVSCAPADSHFWYPVELKHATCGTFEGELYLMENSIGWRSWPYYLEKSTKQEIELGTDCTFRTIKKLPEHEWNVEENLTEEQKKYIIDGFR